MSLLQENATTFPFPLDVDDGAGSGVCYALEAEELEVGAIGGRPRPLLVAGVARAGSVTWKHYNLSIPKSWKTDKSARFWMKSKILLSPYEIQWGWNHSQTSWVISW